MAYPAAPNPKLPRLFICEKSSNLWFLVDTASDVSVIPRTKVKFSSINQVDYALHAANGTQIQTYGLSARNVDINLPKKYNWTFVIADTTCAILGADFLQHFHLLPDLTKRRLFNGISLCSAPCSQKYTDICSVHLVTNITDPRIKELLHLYPALTRPPQYLQRPNHNVCHFIHTTGPPVHEKSRRLLPDIEREVRKQFREIVECRICSHLAAIGLHHWWSYQEKRYKISWRLPSIK